MRAGVVSCGSSEALRGWESEGEGLRLAARARLSCHVPKALHLLSPQPSISQGEEKLGLGACGCQEKGWCGRAVVLARGLPPCPPSAAAALLPQLRAGEATFLGLAFCDSPPPPQPSRGCGSGERVLARPPGPALSSWGSSLGEASAEKSASRPEGAALALSLVLPAVPARERAPSVVLSVVLPLVPELSSPSETSLPVNFA